VRVRRNVSISAGKRKFASDMEAKMGIKMTFKKVGSEENLNLINLD
jgi:hypothetical protein